MKKLTLLLSGIFLTVCSFAQPTLTGANINPSAGERFYSHYCDTTGVSIGPSGGPVTWDMSGLASIFDDSTTYLACAATPYCYTFPGSTLAIDYGSDMEYYITDASKFAVSGDWSSSGNTYYADPQDYIAYPMTYGTTTLDTIIYGQPVDSIYTRGLDSMTGDAYGTLKLPTGTYINVLRVHMIAYSVDSFISGGVTYFDTSRGEGYLWWTPGFHNPLLLIGLDTAGSGTPYISTVIYYNQMLSLKAAQLADAGGGVQVYPNPVKDEAHITFYAKDNEAVTITATDMTGRTVSAAMTENARQGQNDISYSTASLPAGMYLLRIQTADNTVLKKIVKVQ